MLKTTMITEALKKHAVPYKSIMELTPLIKEASRAKFVLLGEASHGTKEYYQIRAELTKELIQKHQFSFLAVEGDWPSCYEVNRYIKGKAPEYTSVRDVLEKSFQRWPSWMWANEEILELIEWMYTYNQGRTDKVGFYGLDVYSLWESMEAIVDYLKKINSPDVMKAIEAIECLDPYNRKPEMYGISAAFYREDCIDEVLDLLQTLVERKKRNVEDDEADLNMKVNAIVASNAELYYRTMVTNDAESWNIRDRHMVEALDEIANLYGNKGKGIVWEHNTHIGDARATDMTHEGMVNVGQVTREKYGEDNIYAVGFGSYSGTVIAAEKWGEPQKVMTVPEGAVGSWEEALHRANASDQYLLFTPENRESFREEVGHRAIGVVYHTEYEHHGNYVPSKLSERYDAFIYVDKTTALEPLKEA